MCCAYFSKEVRTLDVAEVILACGVNLQGGEGAQHLGLPLVHIRLEVLPAALEPPKSPL